MIQTKILSLLSPNGLHQLYEGCELAIVLVQDMKEISDRFVRIRVRDALYTDGCLCDTNMENVKVGDVRWLFQATCINVPGLCKTVKPGKSVLVARSEELDMSRLVEAIELPTQATQCL